MLMFQNSDDLRIVGYSDPNFVECPDDTRFTSGYMFTLVDGAISWENIKQTFTISSTM